MREVFCLEIIIRIGDGVTIPGELGINPAAVSMWEFYSGVGDKLAGAWFMLIGSEHKHMLTGKTAESFHKMMLGEYEVPANA